MNGSAALLAIFFAFASSTAAYAQGGAGEIWGRVTTDTGAVVEGAAVTLEDIDTDATREIHTDGNGRFAFASIPAGRYRVTAEHEGFAGRRQEDIVLLPGQRMQFDLPLRRAPLPETIALNPHAPASESGRTHTSASVGEIELQELPVLGRQYLRLAELTPAVAEDARTGGPSVMGLPSAQNRIVIDGFDHTSSITGEAVGHDGSGRVPYEVSQAALEGFRVQTNGAPAEVGRAAAGVFDVVTRSGSNAFHGSAWEFFGDRRLNGRRTVEERAGAPKAPYRNNQFGTTIGGPIWREHNFFLLSYDGLRRTDAQRQNQDSLLARTDHDYAGQRAMVRYMDQRFDGTPVVLRNRSVAASSGNGAGVVFNEARAQYADNGDEAAAHDFATTRAQFGDSLALIIGAHSLKLGGDVLRDRNTVTFAPMAGAGVSADVESYAAFAQDAWRASNALTIDLGIRYDLQEFHGAMPADRNNWAPRVGFAYSPGTRWQTIRGAYGLFYGTTPALVPALRESSSNVIIDPSFVAPRVHQASLGWEGEKYRVGAFGVDYLFARGDHLPRALVGRIVSLQSTGESVFQGIALRWRARFLNQLFTRFAYTFGNADETPLDSGAVSTRERASNDYQQRLSTAFTWDTELAAANRRGVAKALLDDWQYALVYTWQRGYPYSAFASGDINGDQNAFNDLVPGTVWNQYRLPYHGSLDPRVQRRMSIGGTQLMLIWEAFNLTNRPNYTLVDNTPGVLNGSTLLPNPLLGRGIAQANGRVMQLAARLSF